MPVRDDILNFMRSIKAGKQAVRETEFKQEAVEEAQKQYDKTLEDYARGLTSYEEELPLYQQRVADWQQTVDAQQLDYEKSLDAWAEKTSPQWKTYDQQLAAYNAWPSMVYAWTPIGGGSTMYTDYQPARGTYSYLNPEMVPNPNARPVQPTPPPPPSAPTYTPQPQMTVDHPGDMPSFEFVMPDTPYSSALAKSSQMGSLPSLGSRDQGRYYQAINAQSNQPKWWQR